MNTHCTARSIVLTGLFLLMANVFLAEAEEGFVDIFDGKTLKTWDGNPAHWSVKDGAITGESTKENPAKGNTFCIWRGGELVDFELRLEFRIGNAGNSGIQYRSKDYKNWVIGGYQADFDAGNGWTGTLYEERGRGVLAKRGNKVIIDESGKKNGAGKTTDEKTILKSIKKGEWNDYTIIAQGNHLIQKINDHVTIDVTDNQESKRVMNGLLALQLHAGPPMKVQFKNLRIKTLK